MKVDEKKVEAILFSVGKTISIERISVLCSMKEEQVKKLLKGLQNTYAERDHSLQLVEKEDGWKLTVRDEFVPLVSSIVQSTELERPLMETLAVVAWKYPIIQSDIVKLRGSVAYEHMRSLVEQGFIQKERFGRTYKVKLTKKFFAYFDLPSEEAKQAFLKQIPKDVLQEAESVEKEAEEVERLVELAEQEKSSRSEIEKAMGAVKE